MTERTFANTEKHRPEWQFSLLWEKLFASSVSLWSCCYRSDKEHHSSPHYKVKNASCLQSIATFLLSISFPRNIEPCCQNADPATSFNFHPNAFEHKKLSGIHKLAGREQTGWGGKKGRESRHRWIQNLCFCEHSPCWSPENGSCFIPSSYVTSLISFEFSSYIVGWKKFEKLLCSRGCD